MFCPKLILLAAVISFFLPSIGWSEVYLSLFTGPSLSLKQNIKARTFDSNERVVRRELISSESSPRFKAGGKATCFFHENVGAEAEIFYGQTISDVDFRGTKFEGATMTQRRTAFMVSILLRGRVGHARRTSLYGGLGYGAVYSDFEMIGGEWGKGGQLIAGADFPISDRYSFFLESKYFWAPDVGDVNRAQGERLKVSGNPEYNLAHKVFGPHEDTQIVALLLGIRFKIGI